MQKPEPEAAVTFTMRKNPSICLVYDFYDRRGKALPPEEIRRDYLRQERTAWRSKAFRSIEGAKICADGDSWINILWPASRIFGHQRTFFDVLQERFKTIDVAFPGDTFKQMLAEKDYRQPIGSGIFDFFVFSGGGNDILGGGALVELLRHKTEGGGSADPKNYLFLQSLKDVLQALEDGYSEIADDVKRRSSGRTRMLVHGYDYPVPRRNGVWLGQPFHSKGYDLPGDKDLMVSILSHLVDEFYKVLARVARRKRHVTVVDLRGITAGRWNDELHPRATASRDLAAAFRKVLEGVPVA